MKLQGKIVVVTGAGSGMGREVALELLRRGARVAAADLRLAGLEALAERAQAGDALSLHTVDVGDREAVHALPAQVIAAHGAVDGVIHCAGIIQPFVTTAELDYPSIERVIRVNLWGTIHMIKAFVPHLLERPEAHIANVSSMGGFLPVPGQTIYGASKAAVKLLTEGLYAELHDTPVRVSVVLPGAVATNIAENSGVEIEGGDAPAMQALAADKAAAIILDGVEHDHFQILVGRDARMMHIASRAAPKAATDMIRRKMAELLEHHNQDHEHGHERGADAQRPTSAQAARTSSSSP
ncbi:MAG: SDR family oxidoreductase [Myxococcales bacterium]|nr:SDR family oxidoreductase [Myxococcales bacterium]